MLTPAIQPLQPMSSIINNNPEKLSMKSAPPLGSTWKNSGNINIDLDNLMGSKPKTASPSMNQMASNPTSPVNQPRIINQGPLGAPSFGTQLNFGVQGQNVNNQFFATFK